MMAFLVLHSRRLPSLQRTKRALYDLFAQKHITFIGEGHQITYEFLKEELPSYAVNRSKHTFLVVLSNNADLPEPEAMVEFKTRLDNVISRKIRMNMCDPKVQEKLHVKPHTCQNINQEHINNKNNKTFINLTNYFLCPVHMNELGGNLYLLNFSPKDKEEPCRYSKNGSFYVGAGEIKNETRSETETGWFIVNHLHNSTLTGDEHNCD